MALFFQLVVVVLPSPDFISSIQVSMDIQHNWVFNLHLGDEVTWNDPDNGLCSRTARIRCVKVYDRIDGFIELLWEDGTPQEMFACELS